MIKKGHRLAGYFLMLFANVTVFLGTYRFTTLYKAGHGWFWVAPAQLGVILTIVIYMEVSYRFMRMAEDPFVVDPKLP